MDDWNGLKGNLTADEDRSISNIFLSQSNWKWCSTYLKPRLHYDVLGTACAWNGATFFGHGIARLHLSFCRDGLKIGTGPSTGAILTAHTDFFHGTARQSVNTCVKAGTARLIGVPRQTYLVVLGTAKNLGAGAEPAPFTLSECAVPCQKTAAPVPKYWPAVPKTL